MHRKTKNIISIIIILLLCGSIIFTGYLSTKNNSNNVPNMSQNGSESPTMPNGNSEGEPPAKPEGEMNNGQENNDQNMEEPPAKPEGNTNMEEPPERPSGDNNVGTPPAMPNNNSSMEPMMEQSENNLNNNYIYLILFGIESLTLSIIVLYLIMSEFNKKSFQETFINSDKILIYILEVIILTSGLTFTENSIVNKLNDNPTINNPNQNMESADKEDVVLDESNILTSNNINLSNQKTDVTITSAGTYTFSGNFSNSIIIDAQDEDVEIVLDGVNITNEKTATIIGLNANKITITLNDGTTNTLTDGGNSNYDGCIYSETELVFEGKGKLIVNGNQNEGEGIATEAMNMTFNGGTYIVTSNDDGLNAGGDGATITINDGTFYINASGDGIDSNKDAIINGGTIFVIGSDAGGNAGIDTDKGYSINSGTIVALGSDMIETPKESSNQKVIAFTLNSIIAQNTPVTLMKDEKEIISFAAPKSFKTIIISTNTLSDGEYELYTGGSNSGTLENGIYQNSNYSKGEKVFINNENTFKINETINLFGNKK